MPTTWSRSPEEFHKIYLANTDAFYRIGSANLAPELEAYLRSLGFRYVTADLRGYRTGSMNETLTAPTK